MRFLLKATTELLQDLAVEPAEVAAGQETVSALLELGHKRELPPRRPARPSTAPSLRSRIPAESGRAVT